MLQTTIARGEGSAAENLATYCSAAKLRLQKLCRPRKIHCSSFEKEYINGSCTHGIIVNPSGPDPLKQFSSDGAVYHHGLFSAVKETYFETRAIGPGNVDHNRIPLSIEFRDFCSRIVRKARATSLLQTPTPSEHFGCGQSPVSVLSAILVVDQTGSAGRNLLLTEKGD